MTTTRQPRKWYAINSNPPREVCPKVGRRQKAEYAVISAFVKSALAHGGLTLGVFDGEEHVVKYSDSYKAIMGAIMSVDDEYIMVYEKPANYGPASKSGKRIGWVRLVYGNDGPDVISDYTTNLGDGEFCDDKSKALNLMAKADEVSNRLYESGCY
jgi:hypothetical protein